MRFQNGGTADDVSAGYVDKDTLEGNASSPVDRALHGYSPFKGTEAVAVMNDPIVIVSAVDSQTNPSVTAPHVNDGSVVFTNANYFNVEAPCISLLSVISHVNEFEYVTSFPVLNGTSGSLVLNAATGAVLGMANIGYVDVGGFPADAGGAVKNTTMKSILRFDQWYGTETVKDRTIGVFRPSTRFFFIDKGDDAWVGSGPNADLITSLGAFGDLPLMGDWDGNGTVTIGVYRPSTGFFYLNNTNTPGAVDRIFALGGSGDLPVAGNWDGIGTETTVGIYRPSNRTFYLSNTWVWGVVDIQVPLRASGDKPVVGDWDGDGTVTPGVYRPSTLTFYLLNGFNPAGP